MRTSILSVSKAQREQQWRERFARHAISEQSVEAFCRDEAVTVPMFYYWRTQLRKREQAAFAPVTFGRTILCKVSCRAREGMALRPT